MTVLTSMALMASAAVHGAVGRMRYPWLFRRRNKPVTCSSHVEKIRLKRGRRDTNRLAVSLLDPARMGVLRPAVATAPVAALS